MPRVAGIVCSCTLLLVSCQAPPPADAEPGAMLRYRSSDGTLEFPYPPVFGDPEEIDLEGVTGVTFGSVPENSGFLGEISWGWEPDVLLVWVREVSPEMANATLDGAERAYRDLAAGTGLEMEVAEVRKGFTSPASLYMRMRTGSGDLDPELNLVIFWERRGDRIVQAMATAGRTTWTAYGDSIRNSFRDIRYGTVHD